jgi:hypothetical protein
MLMKQSFKRNDLHKFSKYKICHSFFFVSDEHKILYADFLITNIKYKLKNTFLKMYS